VRKHLSRTFSNGSDPGRRQSGSEAARRGGLSSQALRGCRSRVHRCHQQGFERKRPRRAAHLSRESMRSVPALGPIRKGSRRRGGLHADKAPEAATAYRKVCELQPEKAAEYEVMAEKAEQVCCFKLSLAPTHPLVAARSILSHISPHSSSLSRRRRVDRPAVAVVPPRRGLSR
jgi:hypothetical protein